MSKFFHQGRPGGAGPLDVNLGPRIISETTGVRKLKFKTQLDVVKYSLRVQKFFRQVASRGCRAPNVNVGPLIYRKLLELEM